jgi:phosphotriesterase-related protein
MANFNLAGKAQTVLGPIDPEQLGVTLTHEHLLIDLSVLYSPKDQASARDFFEKPVSLETVGRIRHYAVPNRDNTQLFDVPTAIEEAMLYKQYGGDSLVDATSIGIARDPEGLARISRATGVNVIMGASYYVAPAHPKDMDSRSEDEIVEQIVRDVTEGVDGTTIKSGVIGEVGCSWPLTDNERKVLRASGRAQLLTGAPLLIHPGRDEVAPLEIIEVLSEVGADLGHTIIGHLDRTVFLRDTLMKIAESGCYLEWDLFGHEQSFYSANLKIDMPGDGKRIADIAWTASQGYGRKVVVAHDICSKHRLEKYGGHGYSYILGHIVPRMRMRGYSEEAIHNILVDNPRDALTFVKPTA